MTQFREQAQAFAKGGIEPRWIQRNMGIGTAYSTFNQIHVRSSDQTACQFAFPVLLA